MIINKKIEELKLLIDTVMSEEDVQHVLETLDEVIQYIDDLADCEFEAH